MITANSPQQSAKSSNSMTHEAPLAMFRWDMMFLQITSRKEHIVHKEIQVNIRETKLKNIAKLNTKLKNANWARVYNELNHNTSYEIFIDILISHIDECLPWKKVKVKTETNGWLTKGICPGYTTRIRITSWIHNTHQDHVLNTQHTSGSHPGYATHIRFTSWICYTHQDHVLDTQHTSGSRPGYTTHIRITSWIHDTHQDQVHQCSVHSLSMSLVFTRYLLQRPKLFVDNSRSSHAPPLVTRTYRRLSLASPRLNSVLSPGQDTTCCHWRTVVIVIYAHSRVASQCKT